MTAPVNVTLAGFLDDANCDAARRIVRMAHGLPVRLLIDSPGGLLEPAVRLAEALARHDGPTHGVVAGRCDSAALVPLLACHRRSGLLASVMVVHGVAAPSPPRWNREALRRRLAAVEMADASLQAYFASRLDAPPVALRRWFSGPDARVTGLEARRYGLLTDLLDPLPRAPRGVSSRLHAALGRWEKAPDAARAAYARAQVPLLLGLGG